MDKGHTTTQQDRSIKEDGSTEEQKAMVFVLGQTVKNTMGSGKITKNMAQGPTHGLMAESTKAATVTTKNTAMVPISGPTAVSTLESGKTTNDMAKVYTS